MSTLGGLEVRNTATLLDENTKIAALVWSGPGYGKTTLAATLDAMTRKHFGKKSLVIAVEPGDGGGTQSIQDKGVDFVTPHNHSEMQRLLASLQTDTTYGGIIYDSATEGVKSLIAPYALTFPSREKTSTRTAGVMERSDYQTAGEICRQYFQQLLNLTCTNNLQVRKHLVVTALEATKEEDGRIIYIGPALPGAMGPASAAMFQMVTSIAIKTMLVPDPANPKAAPKRNSRRVLVSSADGVRQLKDRFNILPPEAPMDFVEIYERYWLPKVEEVRSRAVAVAA